MSLVFLSIHFSFLLLTPNPWHVPSLRSYSGPLLETQGVQVFDLIWVWQVFSDKMMEGKRGRNKLKAIVRIFIFFKTKLVVILKAI